MPCNGNGQEQDGAHMEVQNGREKKKKKYMKKRPRNNYAREL